MMKGQPNNIVPTARRMMMSLQTKNPLTTIGFSHCMPIRKLNHRLNYLSTTALTSTRANHEVTKSHDVNNVAIVGGGLAGLSVAYHLLKKTTATNKDRTTSPFLRLTIFDKAPVGTGGASSVAGGLLHPFSPRGKLIHMGLEGLDATNHLVSVASKYEPQCILRDQMYRLALTEQHQQQLEETATKFPQHCDWLDATEMNDICHTSESRGGLRFKSGKVIHVPTYLKGLWKACEELSSKQYCGDDDDDVGIEWVLLQQNNQQEEPSSPPTQEEWKNMLQDFDTVVLSAGAGLLQDQLLTATSESPEASSSWPVQLVRGQSVELQVPTPATTSITSPSSTDIETQSPSYEAVLCGKYVTPLLESNKMLIGATHEFQRDPMTAEEVTKDLRERSYDLAPWLWDDGVVDTITHGWRVQSNRGPHGRTPILGRIPSPLSLSSTTEEGDDIDFVLHDNAWIFTGLSSRGLIHHGLYGEILTDAILANDEEGMFVKHSHLQWWKKFFAKSL